MKEIIIILILLSIISCCNKNNSFDNSFVRENCDTPPDLLIKAKKKGCNELIFEGDFGYYLKEYDIKNILFMRDSLYNYSVKGNGDFLFDFSNEKKTGVLKVNDSMIFKTFYYMDMPSDDGKVYRLFKVKNIDKYYEAELSRVYIANYSYGIVGEFILVIENDEEFVIDIEGYIPNKKHFYSRFKKAQLL